MRKYAVRFIQAFVAKLQRTIAGPEGAYRAGRKYRDRGDFQTAIQAFTQAEEQWRLSQPGDAATSLLQVAYCRARLGDFSRARSDYEEVLKRVRGNPNLKNMPKQQEVTQALEWIKSQQ